MSVEPLADFGAATREEIQLAHDVLCAMLRGEVPSPLYAENVRIVHAVHDCLSWVLGGACGADFRDTMTGIVRVLRRNGVKGWPSHPPA